MAPRVDTSNGSQLELVGHAHVPLNIKDNVTSRLYFPPDAKQSWTTQANPSLRWYLTDVPITFSVILDTPKQIDVRSLIIRSTGDVNAKKYEGRMSGFNMHAENIWTLNVDALTVFPRYDEFKDRASRRIQIPKGRHRFDFRLSLAPTTPGNYDSAHFKVKNMLSMHADLYDLPDLSDSRQLQLAQRDQLLTFAEVLPAVAELKGSDIVAKFTLERNAYYLGQDLVMKCEIKNGNSKSIKAIKMDLWRQWTLGQAHDTKKEALPAEMVQALPLNAPEIKGKTEWNHSLTVTIPNRWGLEVALNNRWIEMHYYLKVVVDVAGMLTKDPEVTIPLRIVHPGTSFNPAPVIPIEIEREEGLGQLPADVNTWTPIHVRIWLRYKYGLNHAGGTVAIEDIFLLWDLNGDQLLDLINQDMWRAFGIPNEADQLSLLHAVKGMSTGRAAKAAIKDFADLAAILTSAMNAQTTTIMQRLDQLEDRLARVERHTLGAVALPFIPSVYTSRGSVELVGGVPLVVTPVTASAVAAATAPPTARAPMLG